MYSNRTDIDPYGSFSIVVRSLADNDTSPKIVERFDNCNLNPNSDHYVAKKVGDMYHVWDDSKKRLTEYGTYPNNSNFMRIEVAPEVDLGQADPEVLPFGVQGPLRRTGFKLEFHTGSGFAAGEGEIFASGSFLSATSSIFDAGVDLQYLNVRREKVDSYKWFDQTTNPGTVTSDSVVWGGIYLGSERSHPLFQVPMGRQLG